MSEIAVLRVFTGLILFVIGIGFFTEEDVPRAQHLVGYSSPTAESQRL